MNKFGFLVCIFVLIPFMLLAQKRGKYSTAINVATTFNYYSPIEKYSYSKQINTSGDKLILQYLTSTSGTFKVQEGAKIIIDQQNLIQMPSQLVGIGANIQILKGNIFQDITLTKLISQKSSQIATYVYPDTLDQLSEIALGYEQQSFAIGTRYEFGRYFGDSKRSKFRFGLSGGVETTYYRFKHTPYTIREYPINTRLLIVEVALIPMLTAQLSKKITLDFKAIPNILVADFGSVKIERVDLPEHQRKIGRSYDPPEINMAFSLLLRYNIKAAKRRKRSAG